MDIFEGHDVAWQCAFLFKDGDIPPFSPYGDEQILEEMSACRVIGRFTTARTSNVDVFNTVLFIIRIFMVVTGEDDVNAVFLEELHQGVGGPVFERVNISRDVVEYEDVIHLSVLFEVLC